MGPILFLIYINDLPDGISREVKLFAGNTKVYLKLSEVNKDCSMLQSDFDLLCDWVRIWQMPFNPDEYEVMRVTHHRDSSILSYNMFGKLLKVSKNFKDLCVIMCYDLKWSEQVNTFVNKANRVLGLIERTVGCTSTVVFAKLYVTLVQPILENACPV